jgi:tetratricopeptide (TPR) repeat protein
VQTWADVRPGWNIVWEQGPIQRARRALLFLGLGPTLLALVGGGLAMADVRRGRRRRVYVPLLALAVLSLAAFAWFALTVPRFSALKASYLLGLTLPFAAFLTRAVEALGSRGRAWSVLASATVVLAGSASAVVHTSGWVVPRLRNQTSVAALDFYFGDFEAARRTSERQLRQRWFRTEWRDNLAAIALVQGRPSQARDLYAAERPERGATPFRWNALAVATALAGDRERAIALLDEAVAAGAGEVAYTNRGTLRAAIGDRAAAEKDLREAVRLDPNLAPAWQALAQTLARSGRAAAAQEARAAAERAAGTTPRGHPYGLPDALAQRPEPGFAPRWLLRLEAEKLRLAPPPHGPAPYGPAAGFRGSGGDR